MLLTGPRCLLMQHGARATTGGCLGRLGGCRAVVGAAGRAQHKGQDLVFDLPRRLTRSEKQEVQEELATALSGLPPRQVKELSLREEDLHLRGKVDLLCSCLDSAGLEQTLRLLWKALEAAPGGCPSDMLCQALVHDPHFSGVLRRAFQQRCSLQPPSLCAAAKVACSILGPGESELAAVAEALMDALVPVLHCLTPADAGALLTVSRGRLSVLPAAARLLNASLQQLAERSLAEVSEEELTATLASLGDASADVNPVVVEDLLDSLRDFWPLCGTSTLLKALLAFGQGGVLDVFTFRALVEQLDARVNLMSAANQQSLLLILALHKSAFDRARILPHPLYDEPSQRLIRALVTKASQGIATAPLPEIVHPVLAMAELNAVSRRARRALEERLGSGRLLSLPPADFVSLAYAYRLAAGPVPQESLRRPFCMALRALVPAMAPRQIASCIGSLYRYSSKEQRHVFEAAYERLASALEQQRAMELEPHEALGPAEVTEVIHAFPEVRMRSPALLERILVSVAGAQSALQAPAASLGADATSASSSRSMLPNMSMGQLVDVLEALGAQGMGGSAAVADAIARRYEANGGRISRRNTARALNALAQVGERPADLLGVLLAELRGWQEQDPQAEDLRPRPALAALWALAALDLVAQNPSTVEFLLAFLSSEGVSPALLNQKQDACLFIQSLCEVQRALPELASRHTQLLESTGSPLGTQAMIGGQPASGLVALPPSGPDLGLSGSGGWVDTQQSAVAPPGLSSGGSVLQDMQAFWELDRRRTAVFSKAQQVLGEVLAALNAGSVLKAAPHPHGVLAAEATRTTGGFELQWASGPYDVDWGHPFLRIGLLVLGPGDFVQGTGAMALRARARLRVRHLSQGWRLVLLRADAIQGSLDRGLSEEEELFSEHLRVSVLRANAREPLERGRALRELKRLRAAPEARRGPAVESLSARLHLHLQKQLRIVFPGAEVPLQPVLDTAQQGDCLAH